MANTYETALAAQVAITTPERWRDGECPAWVESRDTVCGKQPGAGGILCARHRNVADKRFAKRVEKIKTRAKAREDKRAGELAANGDKWRAELTRIDSELERRTGLPTTDPAAWRGAIHPSLRKVAMARLSDSNVSRVCALYKRRDDLLQRLGNK